MTNTKTSRVKEIISHTSIRGIAAMGVVLFHLNITMPQAYSFDRFTGLVRDAWVGVDLFFILSGFVIAYVYSDFLNKDISRKDIRDFYKHRFARIYPLHVLTLVFMLLLPILFSIIHKDQFNISLLKAPGLLDITSNLILVQAWGFYSKYDLNFPSWSISVEFASYIFFPVIAVLWRKYTPPRYFFIFICAYYVILFYSFNGNLDIGERFNLLRGIPSFVLGMILYHYRHTISLVSDLSMSIIQVAVVFSILFIMDFGYNNFLLIPLFSVLVIFTWEDRGILCAVLNNKILRLIGELSFSIYLLHIPVRNTLFYVWPKMTSSFSAPFRIYGFVFCVIATTLVVSYFVYNYFEVPIRNYLKNR